MMTISARAFTENQPLIDLLEGEFDESQLTRYLELEDAPPPARVWEKALLGPARDILSRRGKEFRRNLVNYAWRLSGGASPMPVALELLVEILHAGSLVIDDIEDGSPMRRGAPALHAVYGLAAALNTGNWLYFWPFALLSRLGLRPEDELCMHRVLTQTLMSCHYGQALDLSVKVADLSQREVPPVVLTTTRLKTGSLLSLSARLGALSAGAESDTVSALTRFGRDLGVGLQMLDDLGGLVAQKSRHKGHEDLRLGRVTWPWAWIAERVDHLAFHKLKMLSAEVESRSEHPETLAMAMRKAMGTRGHDTARAHLVKTHHSLCQAIGGSPLLDALEQEIERMVDSYVG